MKFWMCMVQGMGVPKKIHMTIQEANDECERLARKENRMVYLLESIASVSITTPKPPVAWHSL